MDDITAVAGNVRNIHLNILGSIFGIELPHCIIDLEAGCFQRCLQRRNSACIHGAGTAAAIQDAG